MKWPINDNMIDSGQIRKTVAYLCTTSTRIQKDTVRPHPRGICPQAEYLGPLDVFYLCTLTSTTIVQRAAPASISKPNDTIFFFMIAFGVSAHPTNLSIADGLFDWLDKLLRWVHIERSPICCTLMLLKWLTKDIWLHDGSSEWNPPSTSCCWIYNRSCRNTLCLPSGIYSGSL